jgi:FHA domain/Protein of unknown function (DUF3662)
MNPIARIERACERFVEETFARVFPSDLDPAQVGRKLAAFMQAAPGDLFLVRVHPTDYARFAADRELLEARWSALLREALPPAHRAERPRALLHEDARVVAGSVAIETVADERFRLTFERHDGTRTPLRDGLRIGRASDNDIVVRDGRASRHHARIVAFGGTLAIEDLGSSNGTFVDGRPVTRSPLTIDAVVTIGDTQLRVRNADG